MLALLALEVCQRSTGLDLGCSGHCIRVVFLIANRPMSEKQTLRLRRMSFFLIDSKS